MEQLGNLGCFDFDRQFSFAKVFYEDLNRCVELVMGAQMNDFENYQFRLLQKAFSENIKSDLLNLGIMGHRSLDQNIKVLMANKSSSVYELCALLTS